MNVSNFTMVLSFHLVGKPCVQCKICLRWLHDTLNVRAVKDCLNPMCCCLCRQLIFSHAMFTASCEATAPWKPADSYYAEWKFASISSVGIITYFSCISVLPYCMCFSKKLRWTSSLMPVNSAQSSKVHPLPRHLIVPNNSNSMQLDGMPVAL